MSVYVTDPVTEPDGKKWCRLLGTDRSELDHFAVVVMRLSEKAMLPGTPTAYAMPAGKRDKAIRRGAMSANSDVLKRAGSKTFRVVPKGGS